MPFFSNCKKEFFHNFYIDSVLKFSYLQRKNQYFVRTLFILKLVYNASIFEIGKRCLLKIYLDKALKEFKMADLSEFMSQRKPGRNVCMKLGFRLSSRCNPANRPTKKALPYSFSRWRHSLIFFQIHNDLSKWIN